MNSYVRKVDMRKLLNLAIKAFKSSPLLLLTYTKVFELLIEGLSLLNWGRLNDAIDCSKEGLQLFPNHDKLL